ncbi:MAG: DUF3857 domain-containing protein [Candidatus Marinimicrobia bacterium]|nr:DUF3857 domain-containing protein [Candidatus Neomarinimicrobiota bacterium]
MKWLLTITVIPTLLQAVDDSYIISEELRFQVKSKKKATVTYTRRVWVQDQASKSYGEVQILENEFHRIKRISGKILTKENRTIKRLRKRDIRTIKASPGYALYSGNEYSLFNLTSARLPYILEYSYTVDLSSLFYWPNWYPESRLPVQNSRYILDIPSGMDFNLFSIGKIPEPEVNADSTIFTWELTDIPAKRDEWSMAPGDEERYALLFTPKQFVLGGQRGSFDSWAAFGGWYHRLAKEQYSLPGEVTGFTPIPNKGSDRALVQYIYDQIQRETRYVAVELGINSWQPHKAGNVWEKRYGDCKDLSTLFIAMLDKVGIPAYPAIILTHPNGLVYRQFPSNLFNHLITFIPLQEDTLWVDCTTDFTTIDDPPYTIEGCNALVIKDAKGILITTPTSTALDNTMIFRADAVLSTLGDIKLTGSVTADGNYAQYFRSVYRELDEKERRKTFLRWLQDTSPSVDLQQLSFTGFEDNHQSPSIQFDLISKMYATTSRNRLFLTPSFYFRSVFDSEDPTQRETAVGHRYPLYQSEKITYHLPPELVVEAIPDSVTLIHRFGTYQYGLLVEDTRITFSRDFRLNQKRISLDDYPDYYTFRESIEKTDKKRIVFLK